VARPKKHARLGELLVAAGLITEEQLQNVLRDQAASGRLLGDILVDRGYASESDVAKAVGQQLGVPFVDLDTYEPAPDARELVPEVVARAHEVVPLFAMDGRLNVALADPLNIQTLDLLRREWQVSDADRQALAPVGCAWWDGARAGGSAWR